MWWLGLVGRVEAVCSLLLQGTRPRSASDTLMSRRNIPASPLPPSFPLSVVRGRAQLCGKRVRTTGYSVWEDCAGTRRGNAGVRYRKQLAQNEDWVQGAYPQVCAYTAQLYLPEATSGCPSSARAGAPVGAKEVYSAPASPPHKRGMHPVRHLKSLKNVQLTTQLC